MPQNQSIVGVPTSITAFVGRCPLGPTDEPTMVTSFVDFERLFGGLTAGYPLPQSVQYFFANGGTQAIIVRVDGLAPISDPDVYVPADGSKRGVYALDGTPVFNLLCLPPDSADWPLPNVYPLALAYCRSRRAILLVDSPISWLSASDAVGGLPTLGLTPNGENCAIYFPWLSDRSPSGAVAGVIARTDSARGVWRAPAGFDADLVAVAGLSVSLNDQENGELNPLGINCLRSFPGRGNVVWGARTQFSLGDEYRYLPVRRLALFLEASILGGTQWAVFEPNDQPLWAALRLSVGDFMQDLFTQGAFQGATPGDAYFVSCDRSTMTTAEQDEGVVNIVVGFAPLRPAEFVVIRISQMAGPAAS